ncbi:TonB-dependent receptor [Aurantiacibacter gangjinensis]|uniref:TonB-dependent receptor n=1 Tax=Aurantiacibacter gangjinensis TaxID=502682 RepID=A0A0G9MLZ3_9SPHN|nr:TonB-dependent receptor [Aurantiacibacter gangjinensis]APE27701.1 N-acetylglucosamine-regulated TonB-dependent outer membrane receptor [Aurantiacibacter gangjinensis]KLE31710.1 TonB-dependent receptor [Aurantiacibacter gangjinensis]
MTVNRLLGSASIAALAFAAAPAMAQEVTGTVADETDTVSLQSAVIRIEELDRQAVTERDGSYRFNDVPVGTYTLTARFQGVPAESQTVVVPADGVVVADFRLGGDNAETILVYGQRANQANALAREYADDRVVDVLTRDAIGQFPDQNVAESLRRLPGINVLNDQGEGRFVAVRGLDPTLNATSINGVRVPSPEGDTRAVALDFISSDIIESIEVFKSLTPDMDADTIGASIQINTVSAFDRRGNFLTLSAEGSYNEYSEELRPKASANFAYRLADDIGISGGVSYYNRFFETDNIEADDWEEDNGLVYAEEIQYRDYDVERERISGSLGLDFRPSDTTELYVRGLYSRFDDQEFRRRLTFDFGDADVAGSGTSALYDGEITVERDVKDRFERQETYSISLGGETVTGPWTLEYMGSYARSSEREDNSVDPTEFEQEFGDLDVAIDYSDERTPLYSVSGMGAADFFDPAQYTLNDVELTRLSDAVDEEYTGRVDLARDFLIEGGTFTLQTGLKLRLREKTFDGEIEFYENDNYVLADVLGVGPTYRITDLAPLPGLGEATDFFFDNFGDFELQVADSLFDSAASDYAIEEDIYAGYLLGRFESDTLTVIGGVRYEHTQTDIFGNFVLLVEEDGTLPNGDIATDDTVIVSPQVTPANYGRFLPSLNIRWEPQQDLVFRAAGYRSLVRPGFSQIAPRFIAEQNDDDEVEGEFGNPDLDPYEAWNLDLGVDYYFSGNGAVSLGLFYKDVSNYIVDVEYESDGADRLVFNGIAFDEAVIPVNGERSEIFGIEAGFAMQWDMLPAPFDGILTQANYTYTNAEGVVPGGGVDVLGAVGPTRTIDLPATSEHTFNAVLGYEKGPISLRLAGTYRDDYLDELGGSPEEDRFVDSHFQLDATARYRITPNIQVFAQAVNLTDAEYFAFNNLGGRQNNYQYEIYGRTFKGGVRVTF